MPRRWIHATAVAAMLLWMSGCGDGAAGPVRQAGPSDAQAAAEWAALSPQRAMELLREGNGRFSRGKVAAKDLSPGKRQSLAGGQKPFAVIVCCSDSRVPPELVFDQGLGDLFVVRVAGNVADTVVQGSVGYAVEHLHIPLVVVLGHEDCGAVRAAIDGGEVPDELGAILQKIRPSVQAAMARGLSGARAVDLVTDLNVDASVKAILANPVIARLESMHQVQVSGAKYHLVSGQVDWFASASRPSAQS
jgi:carbonic anhydrase